LARKKKCGTHDKLICQCTIGKLLKFYTKYVWVPCKKLIFEQSARGPYRVLGPCRPTCKSEKSVPLFRSPIFSTANLDPHAPYVSRITCGDVDSAEREAYRLLLCFLSWTARCHCRGKNCEEHRPRPSGAWGGWADRVAWEGKRFTKAAAAAPVRASDGNGI